MMKEEEGESKKERRNDRSGLSINSCNYFNACWNYVNLEFFFAIFFSTFMKINVVVVETILGYLLSVEKAYAP